METQNSEGMLTFLQRNFDTGDFDLVRLLPDGISVTPAEPSTTLKAAGEEALHVVVLGAGIGGLTTAYELLKKGVQVTLVEANSRVGGRSLTLRPIRGQDTFTEEFEDEHGRHQVVTQQCKFKVEDRNNPPYLNAGPGRIPSGHRQVLNLCQELKVPLEVYVMETRSSRLYSHPSKSKPYNLENRRIANDVRGYIARDLWNRIEEEDTLASDSAVIDKRKYQDLLANFGALRINREMVDGKDVNVAHYEGSQRAGYSRLPGISAGELNKPIPQEDLLESEFWKRNFYQPEDFLWQTSSFQPVGGMDQIAEALLEKIRQLKGRVLLEAKVTSITKNSAGRFEIRVHGSNLPILADHCVCNIPIPLLDDVIDSKIFHQDYWSALNKVIKNKEFFRPTCKVGWQAARRLWQNPGDPNTVPIYGGISYTSHEMTQMWYPSSGFHEHWGILTGTYNYEQTACKWGKLLPRDRIKLAKQGAEELHGKEFANGLNEETALAVAWQNIPTQRGGWVDWNRILPPKRDETDEERRLREAEISDLMNRIRKGDNGFYVVGDQVSYLPGWKEGAVATALEVYALIVQIKSFELPQITRVPDTIALTQGYQY